MVFPVIAVVKPAKKSVDSLLGHQFAAVGDRNTDRTVVSGFDPDDNFTLVGRVFCRIGQQVVDDLIEFVGIEPAVDLFRRSTEIDLELLSGHKRGKSFHTPANESDDIAMRNTDFQIPALDFPEFEYLLNQSHQPRRIGRHDTVKSLIVPCAVVQVLERSKNNRQRSHQFVSDVGEKLQFGMIQFFGFLSLQLRNLHLLTQPEPVAQEPHDPIGEHQQQHGIDRPGPPRKPRGGEYPHCERPLVAAPHAVFPGSLQTECVGSR